MSAPKVVKVIGNKLGYHFDHTQHITFPQQHLSTGGNTQTPEAANTSPACLIFAQEGTTYQDHRVSAIVEREGESLHPRCRTSRLGQPRERGHRLNYPMVILLYDAVGFQDHRDQRHQGNIEKIPVQEDHMRVG